MTYKKLQKYALASLRSCGSDSPDSEVRELMKYFFDADRFFMAENGNKAVPDKDEKAFISALEKRESGCPLQYIIGQWSFMDAELEVGEGVLIPRDDTEVCVRECMSMIKTESPVIADLCSGSGAIAIALAKVYHHAKIIAVELSEKAFDYLERNILSNNMQGIVQPVKGDISSICHDYEDGYFDVIISNPPYVRTSELTGLQREVRFEPEMALDGGEDGLDFYRIISQKWLRKLKKGGIISLEIGESQGEAVKDMLEKNGAYNVRIIKDIGGLERTVTAII